MSHELLSPGVVVAMADSLVLVGLVLALAGRGRTRAAGAVLAAATGLLLIILNGGYAASWETFTIFALMFTGTMLYRAEADGFPWRRALSVTILVFGPTLVAAQWHVSPIAENYVAIRKSFNSLEFAGLTFAVAMLCRHKKVPRALAWLGLVSYSVYLLHPVLIEVYTSLPWTRHVTYVPTELILTAVFVAVLLVCCGLTPPVHRGTHAAPRPGGSRRGSTPGSAGCAPAAALAPRPRRQRTFTTWMWHPRRTSDMKAACTPMNGRAIASSQPGPQQIESSFIRVDNLMRLTPLPELLRVPFRCAPEANARLALTVTARSRSVGRSGWGRPTEI